ncbi:MAG: hypothetical protein IPK37_08900 [Austwickia sp.]|nr:MAG: hypothetical protein IPK37_08900 [Austwickia sp.]
MTPRMIRPVPQPAARHAAISAVVRGTADRSAGRAGRRVAATTLTVVALAGALAACSDEHAATGSGTTSSSRAATSTPPPGSGATAPGITATSLPPILPTGSTKANVACRKMYPLITEPVTAWNTASTGDAAAAGKAADAMTKAAAAIAPVAKESEDTRLIQLTDAVATQLKAVAADYGSNKDVDGAALTEAQTDLWTYCQSAQ